MNIFCGLWYIALSDGKMSRHYSSDVRKDGEPLIPLTVKLPKSLHTDTKRIAKNNRTTITALVVKGTQLVVEEYQARELRNATLKAQQKELERETRKRSLLLVDAAQLAPRQEELTPDNNNDEPPPEDENAIYTPYVDKIFACNDPKERKRIAKIAVKQIQDARPLSGPEEDVIWRKLDELVAAKLRAVPPEEEKLPALRAEIQEDSFLKRFKEKFMPRQIDPSAMTTFGTFEDPPTEKDGDENE